MGSFNIRLLFRPVLFGKPPQNQLEKAAELVNTVLKQTTTQTRPIDPIQK